MKVFFCSHLIKNKSNSKRTKTNYDNPKTAIPFQKESSNRVSFKYFEDLLFI